MKKTGSPLPRHIYVSNILKKNITRKVKKSKRFRLTMYMKLVPTIFHAKEFINKNSEKKKNNFISPKLFFGDHRGKVYIKKINMTHLSPRT